MATGSQVERSWRARKAWVSRWENKLERLQSLKASWPDDWLEKNRQILPDRSEKELRQKVLEQKSQNRRWLKNKREKFNDTLPEADDI